MHADQITNCCDKLPFPAGLGVKVTKLSACKVPVVEPTPWEDWVIGGDNPLSLPVDYQMRGHLLDPVRVGGRIRLWRTHRNNVEIEGYFYSSPICSIQKESYLVETFNSIYKIEPGFRVNCQ